jgi:hypothetical protein
VSQTDNKPAVQGSFDYKHPIGAYLGIWGSNVDDYVSKGNIELDFYGGYARQLLTDLNMDVSLPYEFTLSGLVGYQWVEGNQTTGHGDGDNGHDGYDYTHWRIGISRPLLGFVLDLSYNDTNNAGFLGKQIADERVVFSVSRTF